MGAECDKERAQASCSLGRRRVSQEACGGESADSPGESQELGVVGDRSET